MNTIASLVWEVISVTHDKRSGKVQCIFPYSWLLPMTEQQARKMAWSCDVWPHRDLRIRRIGEAGIGEPHNWLKHAPPEFFQYFERVSEGTYRG